MNDSRMCAAPSRNVVAVYGAGGHTGGFVVDELARRGIPALAVGRRDVAARAGAAIRIAAVDDRDALISAFADCVVVINAAGPFLDTAGPVVDAALAAGCHYIDVTAEQESALRTLATFDAAARARGLAVIPAAGFFGGFADLLASDLAGPAPIERIDVVVALDRWWPTAGTRRTGERNRHARRVVADGVLVPMALPAARRDWDFGGEHGVEAVEAMPLSEIVTLSHHLDVRRVDSWLGATALRDIRDAATPEPPVVDARGRSAQTFVMEVALLDARGERRATARGRDIYAVSAPLVVEAAQRLLDGGAGVAGATTLGAAFDARAMLRALAPTHFEWHFAEG